MLHCLPAATTTTEMPKKGGKICKNQAESKNCVTHVCAFSFSLSARRGGALFGPITE